MVIFAHCLTISWNVAALECHLVSKLGSSQVLSFVFDNHLVEKVIFLIQILFA